MKFNYLHSSDLPQIDTFIKECINAGTWFLFKSYSECADERFYLKANSEIYTLDLKGNILNCTPLKDCLDIDELYYFDDIKRPISLSNLQVSASF